MVKPRPCRLLSLLFSVALLLEFGAGSSAPEQAESSSSYALSDLRKVQKLLRRRRLDSHLRHGEWHSVEYKGTGHTVLQIDLNERCATHVVVVELGQLGSRIQVRDGPDHVLGMTTQGRKGYCDPKDPDECLRHDGASSGEFVVDTGPHNVQFRVVSAPYSRGALAVRIDYEMCPETSR